MSEYIFIQPAADVDPAIVKKIEQFLSVSISLKIADAFGLEAETIDSENSIDETFDRALKIVQDENRPYLLDVRLPTGLPEGGSASQPFKMR